jgi:hypothetical protein
LRGFRRLRTRLPNGVSFPFQIESKKERVCV